MTSQSALKAEEYIFKGMMPPETYELLMRVRSVISSCESHMQLFYAMQYNLLARHSVDYDWCLDGFIDRKSAEIKDNIAKEIRP